jgi:hypothetical protein
MNATVFNELHSKFNNTGFYYEIINDSPYISDTKILEIVKNFEFPKLYLTNINMNNYLDDNTVSPNESANIIEIIYNDYTYLKPWIAIIDDFMDCMFDEMYYGKIIMMIKMCKAYINRNVNEYKYTNLISKIWLYKDKYSQFDRDDNILPDGSARCGDDLNIYDMGIQVLSEFITHVYKLYTISGTQQNMYDLSKFTTYRYTSTPYDLKNMLSILEDIYQKYKHYRGVLYTPIYCESTPLYSIISIYHKIEDKYKKLSPKNI